MNYLLLIFSLALAGISVFFSYKYRVSFYVMLGLFFVLCFLSGLYLVANDFTWVGINHAVIYHLHAPIAWADIQWNIDKVIIWFLSTIFSIFFLWLLIKHSHNHKWKWNGILTCLFMLFAIIMHPATKNIYELTHGNYQIDAENLNQLDSDFVTTSQYEVEENTKNLVYIYLESLESGYLDNEKFPWLTPNLQKLSKANTAFSNVRQMPGTGWTIAWMVSSQCGIPLIVGNNEFWWMDQFYPKANCMWDILKQQDYFLSYVWWADKTFAGKNLFYQTHKFDEIYGKQDYYWNDEQNSWGLYDETTLKIFLEKYNTLAKKQQKFWLFWLTLDTHGPNGFVSPSCPEYNQEENNILNAVHCTDYLIGKLVENIQNNPDYKDTLIVLASDHLQMWTQKNHKLIWTEHERKNLFIMLDDEKNTIDEPMSTLDIWPIVLNNLWIKIDELWFWKNILKNYESFVKKYYKQDESKDDYFHARKMLFSYKKNIAEFLDFPYLTKKVLINKQEETLILWDKKYKYPVLVFFDENKKIYDIISQVWNNYTLNSYEKSWNYLWIDKCENMDNSDNNLENNFCYKQNVQDWIEKIQKNHVVKIK